MTDNPNHHRAPGPRRRRRGKPPELVTALRHYHETRAALEQARRVYRAAKTDHKTSRERLAAIREHLAAGAVEPERPLRLPAGVRAAVADLVRELRQKSTG